MLDRVTTGFSPDGRVLPARAGDPELHELELKRSREEQERQRLQAEARQEAQREWARQRNELRDALAARERIRADLRSGGPGVLSPEDLAAVQTAAYLAGAETVIEAARAALADHERRSPL